ncbi:hypothetical protein Strop_1068 [Salinispora tropica CNB-440]|uniref:Uncharacterized protein n=1 Tax=Salinispora tropica (strain ATCC BAA-916 / DSM 44818 / JCM 13857 / NBRC 105044 / CNB-440) TaxID=369723 RepID=A4X3T9_SALTO|nr:hypothetical protein Strop_1068 [Salinispora tropica CNB-440]
MRGDHSSSVEGHRRAAVEAIPEVEGLAHPVTELFVVRARQQAVARQAIRRLISHTSKHARAELVRDLEISAPAIYNRRRQTLVDTDQKPGVTPAVPAARVAKGGLLSGSPHGVDTKLGSLTPTSTQAVARS